MTSRWARSVQHLHRIPEVWRCARIVSNWWTVTKAYLQLGKVQYPLKFQTVSGVDLELQSFDELVTAWVVFCRQEYQVPPTVRTIVDIGANYGAFTVLAARSAPNSRIVSVEPFPANYERLQGTVRAHRLEQRVTCWQEAIGGRTETRAMPAADEIPSHLRGLMGPSSTYTGPLMPVATTELGDLLRVARATLEADRIDLLKMDVEGVEHECLDSIAAGALDEVDALQLEYHPNGSREQLFECLHTAGFRCGWELGIGRDCGVAHFARASMPT